jgi:HAD superfamily hydrolase (TIGR01450 family)
VAGYRHEAVESLCRQYSSVNVVINNDYATTNNMYSLGLALRQGAYENGFVLCNGDVVYDPEIVKNACSCGYSCIAVDEGSYDEESMKIVIKDGIVSDISKTISAADAFGNSLDLYKFTAETAKTFADIVFRSLDESGNEWTEVALQRAVVNGSILMKPLGIDGRGWVEIDNYDDLAKADLLFSGIEQKLNETDAWFVDLDGTLYIGEDRIDGAGDFVSLLRKHYRVFLYSNNSSRNKKQYVEKLRGFNIEATEDDILLSTEGAFDYLHSKGIKNIFVLGTKALSEWAAADGFMLDDESPDCVLVGYDTELTYAKLQRTAELINAGVPYYATHPDVVCPTEKGPIPDIGALVDMLRATTGHEPVQIFGKPSKWMVEPILKKNGLTPERVLFIGDRLYTDKVLADSIGAGFILVLSGESQRGDAEDVEPPPACIVKSVADLNNIIGLQS